MKIFSLIIMILLSANLNGQDYNSLLTSPKSDVYLQGFYWNSPPGGIWWDSLARIAPRLASAGFSAIWYPSPAKGAGGGMSMGYDPYDHYDFGEFYQKGSRETRFGSRSELINSIKTFHQVGIQVIADAVMNHMIGGEEKIPYECKPYPSFPDSAYLLFNYPNGSGRFKKDARHFYPNSVTCNVNPPYHGADDPIFAFGEWLAHDRPIVRDSLIEWGKYLKNVIGFNGFRIDAVKGIDPAFMGPWLHSVNQNGYAVAEYYGDTGGIMYWYNQTANVHGGSVSMFDFPLRFTLRDMCNNTSGTWDMNNLDNAGLINSGMSGFNVSTWVENHDVDRIGWDGSIDNGHDPIMTNKDMAYAYIMFSEGRPSVFFKDYFDYGFGGKIDTLIWIRQNFLHGGTTKRNGLNPFYTGSGSQTDLSKKIYVARREGGSGKPQSFIVINNHPTEWRGVWVSSNHPNQVFRDFTGKAIDKTAAADGRVELYAPPRGYAIYIPDTTSFINHPPVIEKIGNQISWTNSNFELKVNVSDANNDQLFYTISGKPVWLNFQNGRFFGKPTFADTGRTQLVITVTDIKGASDKDTFYLDVLKNFPPTMNSIPDTSLKATSRFEYQAIALDPDYDTLRYFFSESPGWLNVNFQTGFIVGTPTLTDTGFFKVTLLTTDGKGAFDSASFFINVSKNIDTLIATYGKPKIDGNISIGSDDWLAEWQVAVDPDSDSFWRPLTILDNELLGIFATWDADSLYFGVDYVINDNFNTMMLYIDAGFPNGITNFHSSSYNGDYAKNFRFRNEDNIDFFFATYFNTQPSFYKIDTGSGILYNQFATTRRGIGGRSAEMAIAWNDVYNLGPGIVLPNVIIKLVTVVAGGFNWGAGDSCPDNLDTDGNSGPDSLINLVTITPDTNGDGVPDPTIIITSLNSNSNYRNTPTDFVVHQNYPNPFNPTTQVSFAIPTKAKVKLEIFDILGRSVSVLVNETLNEGVYSYTFNAAQLPSGIYFYKISADKFVQTRKMLLLK
ncbi:MAG: DUF1939 domain-containing protein [Ignavibacteriaceae bacterium]|nr:DUF1939 domain-containing protein [Ignavibacteriaceae bacterium]